VKPKFYSRFKEFEAMPKHDSSKPIVRCSGPYEVKEDKPEVRAFITSFGKFES